VANERAPGLRRASRRRVPVPPTDRPVCPAVARCVFLAVLGGLPGLLFGLVCLSGVFWFCFFFFGVVFGFVFSPRGAGVVAGEDCGRGSGKQRSCPPQAAL